MGERKRRRAPSSVSSGEGVKLRPAAEAAFSAMAARVGRLLNSCSKASPPAVPKDLTE